MHDSSFSFPVDASNPGQYLACCGALEIASRLWQGAKGWFSAHRFHIAAQADGVSLKNLLVALQGASLSESTALGAGDDEDSQVAPLQVTAPFTLQLDWWRDKEFKTWAGSMEADKMFLAMCHSVDTECDDPLNHGCVAYLRQQGAKPDKREPFYFDSRRGNSSRSVDIGFSPNKLEMQSVAYPAVEALCFIGLQRCRPKAAEKRTFDYFTWRRPLPLQVIPVAVVGGFGAEAGYRFHSLFRTGKHKGFSIATRLH